MLVTALSTVYQWLPLGIHLGLSYSKLKVIDVNQRGQIEMCKIDMLAMWLQGPEEKRNKQILKKALQQLGKILTLVSVINALLLYTVILSPKRVKPKTNCNTIGFMFF